MELKEDLLYQNLDKRRRWFVGEATKHKRLNRWLWLVSIVLSMLIALGTNFDLSLGPITSSQLGAGLAILLPAMTAYTVLRSPERLWILETNIRNQLSDLQTRMELEFQENPSFDRKAIREAFLLLMEEANAKWTEIKRGS